MWASENQSIHHNNTYSHHGMEEEADLPFLPLTIARSPNEDKGLMKYCIVRVSSPWLTVSLNDLCPGTETE